MGNEQGNPVGRDRDLTPGELADRMGTPAANTQPFFSGDRELGLEPTDEDGVVSRDDDGYVGKDGKMQPHQSPLEVAERSDLELDAENLDATEREGIEEVRGIWEQT